MNSEVCVISGAGCRCVVNALASVQQFLCGHLQEHLDEIHEGAVEAPRAGCAERSDGVRRVGKFS